MQVVSFYAPRPDHPFFQDYTPFLDILELSCRRYGHRHIVLTDADLPGFETFRVDLPHSLMKAATAAQLAYLKSDLAKTDTVLLGADCVLGNDPERVFETPFDLAVTTHPFNDCILNTGAIYVRGGVDVSGFWEDALATCGDQWGDDQKSLKAAIDPVLEHDKLIERRGLQVQCLPVDPYNLAPEHPGDDCTRGVVIHFRGDRKNWMKDYCARHLGLGSPVEAIALCNTPDETYFANVRANSLRPLPWVAEEPAHDGHAVIVGGGPSLADTLAEITWRAAHGQTIFALNGAAKFLNERGVRPDALIVIDARPDNLKFIVPAGRYYLASQCDPSLFDAAPVETTRLFHCSTEGIDAHLPLDRNVTLVGGGITSGLTAMNLAWTLGYRKIHLYGYDSSDRDGAAHPYEQSETAPEKKRLEVWCDGKRFLSGFAMFKQAEAFPPVAQALADADALITVHGDGLLPTLARTMATATLLPATPL